MNLIRHLPRFQQAYRALEELAARESWNRQQIEEYQLGRINQLWEHATQHVPYYQRLSRTHALPRRFESVADFQHHVPLLPKQAVNQDSRQFLSQKAGRGSWSCTSGSNGKPTRCFASATGHQEMLRARYRHYAMWDIDIFDRAIFLWGQPAVFLHGWQRRLAALRQQTNDRLRGRLRLPAYHLAPETLRDYLRQMERFQPAMIYGYSHATHLLAQQALAEQYRCKSLKLVTVTSEPATIEMRETITTAFGVPAVVEYGAIECGVIASQWPDGTLRVREDVVLVETLATDEGRYQLVITPLYNPSFPLIRYAIGDLTDRPLHTPAVGFATLGNILGRDNDLIVTRSGRFVHPALLEGIFEHELFDQVRCFKIHQQASGTLEVQLELKDPTATADVSPVVREFTEIVEGYPIEVEIVTKLTTTAAGKHRWIASDLAKQLLEQERHAASQPRSSTAAATIDC